MWTAGGPWPRRARGPARGESGASSGLHWPAPACYARRAVQERGGRDGQEMQAVERTLRRWKFGIGLAALGLVGPYYLMR